MQITWAQPFSHAMCSFDKTLEPLLYLGFYDFSISVWCDARRDCQKQRRQINVDTGSQIWWCSGWWWWRLARHLEKMEQGNVEKEWLRGKRTRCLIWVYMVGSVKLVVFCLLANFFTQFFCVYLKDQPLHQGWDWIKQRLFFIIFNIYLQCNMNTRKISTMSTETRCSCANYAKT